MTSKTKKTKGFTFTQVENSVLRSETLSPKAKLVYAVIKSHVDMRTMSWRIPISQIAKEAGYCERSVYNALAELREAGLIQVTQNRRGGTQFASTYTVTAGTDRVQEMQDARASGCTPCISMSATDAGYIYDTQIRDTNTCVSDFEAEGTQCSEAADVVQVDELFNTFWECYPKRIEKRRAQKVFRRIFAKARDPAERMAIMENIGIRLARYVEDVKGIEPRYIKAPASWLASYDFTEAPEADEVLMEDEYV